MPQETSYSPSNNRVTRVDAEWRGVYMSHTSYYSSHYKGDHGILLTSPVSSRCIEENIHEKEKGTIRVDNGRRIYRSK